MKDENVEKNDAIFKSEVEKVIIQIFKETLGVSEISINDNIFEMGVDSLTAIRIMTELINMFEYEIPFNFMFENQTINEMTNAIFKDLIERKA